MTTETVEVNRPPSDSGAFLPPSEFISSKGGTRNPSWRPTVTMLRSDLVALKSGDFSRLWAVLLTRQVTPKLQAWLDGLILG